MKEIVSKKELFSEWGIKYHTVQAWIKDGMPMLSKKEANIVEATKWVIGKYPQSKHAAKLADYYAKLRQAGLVKDQPPLPAASNSLKDIAPVVYGVTDGVGIEAAVTRLRNMESSLGRKIEEKIDANDTDIAADIKSWQSILDLLRKAEADLLSILERQKVLVPYDCVKQIISTMCLPVRSRLFKIVTQVSPELEGQDLEEIQLILDKEIRKALAGLGDFSRVDI